MSTNDHLIRRAIAAGILPANATVPALESRPWPVILLTALGVWMAALPLFGVAGLLLGDVLKSSLGALLIGSLALAGATALLHRAETPLFFEQLALPLLLLGLGLWGIGLNDQVPDFVAFSLLALLALLLAIAIPRQWLRQLLGAAAAMLLMLAFAQLDWRQPMWLIWLMWLVPQLLLGVGMVMLWLQTGRYGTQAIALEGIAGGWLVVALGQLALLSGTSFLIGGALGPVNHIFANAGALTFSPALQALSVLLTLAAATWSAMRWHGLRTPWCGLVALLLAPLAWYMPNLGATLLALAVTATSGRFRLAALAALVAAWIIGGFYASLQWPLADKAVLLVGLGALLGAVAWKMSGGPLRGVTTTAAPMDVDATATASPNRLLPRAGWLVLGAGLLTLAVANVAILQKERLIARGTPVFVELAPVDPRSLMQGDYMQLAFRLPPLVALTERETPAWRRRPYVVARLDARQVASLLRVHQEGEVLQPDEFLIELTPRNGSWTLVTDAWFFREGDAARWEGARYGEFRVQPDGKALLVGLVDGKLQALAP